MRYAPGSPPVLHDLSPARAGWRFLSFQYLRLSPGASHRGATETCEVALVPLQGRGVVRVGQQRFELSRQGVFDELPSVLYLPPGLEYAIEAQKTFEFTLGGAPAEGRYPLRLFAPRELPVELRGGGPALRQVTHVLGPALPAERLIVYEVYTPSGFWSGWPPHRHDGVAGSPYFEETYFYRIDPPHGYALHQTYDPEGGFEELFRVRDRELVVVPRGYHPVAAPPGSNVYYLNYMAGEPSLEGRSLPPYDEPEWAWMRNDWSGRPLQLPLGGARAG